MSDAQELFDRMTKLSNAQNAIIDTLTWQTQAVEILNSVLIGTLANKGLLNVDELRAAAQDLNEAVNQDEWARVQIKESLTRVLGEVRQAPKLRVIEGGRNSPPTTAS